MVAKYIGLRDAADDPWPPRNESKQERDPERWRLAYHEAAHAALYTAINAQIGYVTLNPTMFGREEVPAHVHLEDAPKNKYQKLVGHLVGMAAERIILGIDYKGESQDKVNARKVAATMDRDVMAYAEAAAEKFVRANQDQIISLAGFLDQEGELSGLEVDLFLQRQPPLQAVPPALTKHPDCVLDGTVSMGRLNDKIAASRALPHEEAPAGYRRVANRPYLAFKPVTKSAI